MRRANMALLVLLLAVTGCATGDGSGEAVTAESTTTTTVEPSPTTTQTPATTTTTSPPTTTSTTTTTSPPTTTTTTTPRIDRWQRADLAGLDSINIVATGRSGFVIAGLQGGSLALWTSSDGLTWSFVDMAADAFPPDYVIHNLVWTGSEYIALARAWQNTTDPVAWRSADLETWQPIDLPCPTHPSADEMATPEGATITSGSCDGDSTIWTSSGGGNFLRSPAPFAGAAAGLVHAAGSWYALSGPTLWRSVDGAPWTAVDLPVLEEWELRLAAQTDTLYLVANGYGPGGELWTRTGDAEWIRVEGALSVGEDLYHGGAVVAGPAGTLVSWSVGYWPGAHQSQSPACLDRGEFVVCLCRPSGCVAPAVSITDADGEMLLEVDFPDGEGPPSHVEINVKSEEVRFLHPSTGTVLAELTFAEIEDALRLSEPEQHTWWSADGSSWTEWTEAHFHARPRWTAIGDSAVVAVEWAEQTDLPRWVQRMLGLRTDPLPEVWVRQTG